MALRIPPILLLLLAAVRSMAGPLLWGDLVHGPYAVGFRSYWTTDPRRTFNYRFPDGSRYGKGRPPRPILVNVWYPAKAPLRAGPMKESGYLDFVPAKPALLRRFAAQLAATNLKVVCSDVSGVSLKDRNPVSYGQFERYLNLPTAAYRNALPAVGRFPVAVYLTGYGSSVQDNSALCEYLASNGYVVYGSAYQDEEGHMIATHATAADDIAVLVELARKDPHIDPSKIAVVGHSGGAQAALVYASREGSLVDAVVSLDTTQDYYFEDKVMFRDYLARVDTKGIRVPALLAACAPAIFQFADRFKESNRTYLTVDALGHDEFTSQGLGAALVQAKKSEADVRERYSSLCTMVRRFLDAKLKGGPGLGTIPAHFQVEQVAKGQTAPDPYALGTEPPSPRQFRILVDSSPDKALEVLSRFTSLKASCPLYDGQIAFAVIDHLLDKNAPDAAREFAAAYHRAVGTEVVGAHVYIAWARIYEKRAPAEAIRDYEKALTLDPENEEAKKGLAKLKGGL